MPTFGHVLLLAWRKATHTSQSAVASAIGSLAPTVCRWELQPADAPPTHRPSAAQAVRLQHLSGGEVPAVSWGYTPDEIESLLRAAVGLTTAHGIAGAVVGTRHDPSVEVPT